MRLYRVLRNVAAALLPAEQAGEPYAVQAYANALTLADACIHGDATPREMMERAIALPQLCDVQRAARFDMLRLLSAHYVQHGPDAR